MMILESASESIAAPGLLGSKEIFANIRSPHNGAMVSRQLRRKLPYNKAPHAPCYDSTALPRMITLRRLSHLLCFLVSTIFLLVVAPVVAEQPVPVLSTPVTDISGVLSASERQALEQKLVSFTKQRGSQIAVLILPTTQPEAIESFSMRVAEGWKLGRKGVDDGVLLTVATKDHALRIEVGYGLEGALPDAIAKRIIDEVITPHFRQGRWFGGLDAGTDAIIKVVSGEALPAPTTHTTGSDFAPAIFPILFILLLASEVLSKLFGRLTGSSLTAMICFVIAALLAPFAVALMIGIVSFFLSLFGLGSTMMRQRSWSSGGWSGGSGGGFSGGGGSFGGGGASGRW